MEEAPPWAKELMTDVKQMVTYVKQMKEQIEEIDRKSEKLNVTMGFIFESVARDRIAERHS
jgi:hypothetical protein